jgi:hypothetical protein
MVPLLFKTWLSGRGASPARLPGPCSPNEIAILPENLPQFKHLPQNQAARPDFSCVITD